MLTFARKIFVYLLPDEALLEILAHTLSQLGVKRAMVVYGQDKLDEISLSASTSICELKNQVTSDDIFQMVAELRQELSVPMVIMTYANVVFSYGTERFIEKAATVGIDGLILPDVPFEEKDEFSQVCQQFELAFISLIAPTSKNRIEKIAQKATGFLYCVSSLGVTGVRQNINTELASMIATVRKVNPTLPVAIGFGIATSKQTKK